MRIMRRACEAGLQVLLRTKDQPGVAVRARAMRTLSGASMPTSFRVSGISLQGIHHLQGSDSVSVEFVGLSTQIAFTAKILAMSDGSLTVAMPAALRSIERRKNFRVATSASQAAFVTLSLWHADEKDAASPPVFPHLAKVASQLRVADISETGVCLLTRFPSVMNTITQGTIDDGAKLRLPMIAPKPFAFEVRWIKRIKETVVIKGEPLDQRLLRVGAQFVDPSEDIIVSIRQFMHQISVADAI